MPLGRRPGRLPGGWEQRRRRTGPVRRHLGPAPPGRRDSHGAGVELPCQLRRQLLHRGADEGAFFPTETPYTIWPPVPGQPRIGWPGYQGTYADINANLPPATGATPGTLRGMFDCTTNQSVRIASITDGTSNTIAAGESLPAQRGDNNVWQFNANADGTTVPINYPTPQTCDPLSTNGFGTPNWASRCCLRQHRLQEPSPRRRELPLRRRVSPLPQAVDCHDDLLCPRQPQRG